MKASGFVGLIGATLYALLATTMMIKTTCVDANVYALSGPSTGNSLSSTVSAMYLLGDSSVDCGKNTLFISLLGNFSLHSCNGSDAGLLPQLLAEKMSLPYIAPFYSQNGSVEGFLNGVNFGSSQATILNPNWTRHQSLHQQLRQAFETFQDLQLLLGEENANHFINSSIFYLSFGKEDYNNLLFQNNNNSSSIVVGPNFSHILVDQMILALRSLYNANVRKIVCVGILPLGCAPRYASVVGDEKRGCLNEINNLVLEYNTRLEEHIVDLNMKFPDAKIVYCDVYRAMMEIINNPEKYGFEDGKSACCGQGKDGCVSPDMACNQASSHVWWDLENPTEAANSLVADSAWSGRPMPAICRPITIQQLTFSTL